MAIPNCKGSEFELEEAYKWQRKGYNVIVEHIGIREHCFIKVLDKKGR